MFGNLIRRRPVIDQVDSIFAGFVDANGIWSDLQSMGGYSVSPVVACCEIGFARIALLKYLVRQIVPDAGRASEISGRIDQLTRAGFKAGDEETFEYYLLPLPHAASQAVAFYLIKADHPTRLTALLTDRIGGKRELVLANSDLFRSLGAGAAVSLTSAFCGKRKILKR